MRQGVLATAAALLAAAMAVMAAGGPPQWEFNDGNDFYWLITNDCSVGWGTNKIYNGGLLPHINGTRFDAGPNGNLLRAPDKISDDKRELFIGPWTNNDRLQIDRRVRVSDTAPWCRVIDTYLNTSDQEIKFTLNYRIDMRYGIRALCSAGGADKVDPNDGGFLTQHGADSEVPTTCHIFAHGKALLLPAVKTQIGSGIFTYEFPITIPARQSVLLCFFESQQHSADAAAAFLKDFDPAVALKDVPPELRRLIVNMRLVNEPWALLARDTRVDRIQTAKGVLQGAVKERDFEFSWRLGALTLKAGEVTGMYRDSDDANQVWVILADGQALRGPCPQGGLEIAADGNTTIVSLADITTWSYRASDRRPLEYCLDGPCVTLHTGERIRLASRPKGQFVAAGLELAIDSNVVEALVVDEGPAAKQWLHLAGGSVLAGKTACESLELTLSAGVKATAPVTQIASLRSSLHRAEALPEAVPAELCLRDGSCLRGTVTDTQLKVASFGGDMPITMADVHTLLAGTGNDASFSLRCWGKEAKACRLACDKINVEFGPGLSLAVPVRSIVSLRLALSNSDFARRVNALVTDLNSDDFKTRQGATDELIRMGPDVVPLLQGHRNDNDPEVRIRIENIIKRNNPSPKPAPVVIDEEG